MTRNKIPRPGPYVRQQPHLQDIPKEAAAILTKTNIMWYLRIRMMAPGDGLRNNWVFLIMGLICAFSTFPSWGFDLILPAGAFEVIHAVLDVVELLINYPNFDPAKEVFEFRLGPYFKGLFIDLVKPDNGLDLEDRFVSYLIDAEEKPLIKRYFTAFFRLLQSSFDETFSKPMHHLLTNFSSQSKLSQEQLSELQRSTHFDKKELQQWYKGMFHLNQHK